MSLDTVPRNRGLFFVTHPDVEIDPDVPVTEWRLNETGRKRMAALLKQPWMNAVTTLACSAERKARDGAEIIGDALGVTPVIRDALGENDRSSTGYLPPIEFEALADRFFAEPDTAVRGWAPARVEQDRIVTALTDLMHDADPSGNTLVVAHGAVGALALAHYLGEPISRAYDQPPTRGRNFFCLDIASRGVRHGWRRIDAPDP